MRGSRSLWPHWTAPGTPWAPHLQSLAGVADPDHVVLGGRLADWLPWLRPGIDARLAARRGAFPAFSPAVTPGHLGDEAALHGALAAGREHILADPAAVPKGA
ncbi:hypothetical protein SFUMM280S_04911 [Streptomyces fumanus]